MTGVLHSAIYDLIYNPNAYWPDDSYFHRRNRQKLARAWASLGHLHDLDPSKVVDHFVDILERRRDLRVTNLYVMSNGGSGCHFLGQLLDGLEGLRFTDEVYFPPRLLKQIEASSLEQDTLAIDFINFFHAGTVDQENHELKIINIGHLRPDTPPARLSKIDCFGRFVLLVRNPYEVAVSRAFRKTDYRAKVAPGMSDDEYLQRQVDGTKAFLSRCRTYPWHRIVRYEQLRSDPRATVGDLVRELGVPFDVERFEVVRRRHDASRISASSASPEASNLNTRPQEVLTPEQIKILTGLADLATEFGYEEPELVLRSRERARRSAGLPVGSEQVESSDPAVTSWLPQYVKDFHYREARFHRFTEGYLTVFQFIPEAELAPDPTWAMDPLRNKTWRLFYHTLSWLAALAWGVDHGPNPETARLHIGQTVSSYLDANVFSRAADKMAWDDHATADRLAVLCYLWVGYLSQPLPLIERNRLLLACEIHVDRLVEFYESKRWLDSNHGLFHALALLGFAIVFDGTRSAGKARSVGSEYLQQVVANLVETQEGVSLEQALYYHQFNLRLLRSARGFLDQSYPDLARALDGVTDGMVDFNLCVRAADNTMPAIGDTQLSARIPADCLSPAPGETTTDHAEYIDSRGVSGRPFPPLTVYPKAGYAVFRRGEVFDGPVTRCVFLFHPERVAHGHFDALGLTLHIAGRDVLIDSGGPYAYGETLRFSYFMASRAHNVLLIDDRDHTAAGRLVGQGEVLDCEWVTCEHSGYDSRTVTRTVIAVADQGFIVLDSVTAGEAEADFDMLWHLPAGSRIEPVVAGQMATASLEIEGERFTAHMVASTDLVADVVEGRLEPTPQGWVTEAPGAKRPAPVLVVSARDVGLLVATVFARSDAEVDTQVTGGAIAVTLGDRAITLTGNGPPAVDLAPPVASSSPGAIHLAREPSPDHRSDPFSGPAIP